MAEVVRAGADTVRTLINGLQSVGVPGSGEYALVRVARADLLGDGRQAEELPQHRLLGVGIQGNGGPKELAEALLPVREEGALHPGQALAEDALRGQRQGPLFDAELDEAPSQPLEAGVAPVDHVLAISTTNTDGVGYMAGLVHPFILTEQVH